MASPNLTIEKSDINEQSVKGTLERFKNNLLAIDDYFQTFGNMAADADNKNAKKKRDEFDQCFKDLNLEIKPNGGELKLSRPQISILIKRLNSTTKISIKNFEILSKSALLMLNNYLEYLLSDLLAYHYDKFKNSLNDKKFNVTLKDLTEYDTIAELTKALITKEVESMIVEFSFDDLIAHFHNKLGIDKEEKLIDWNFIAECRERRHLIVHNSSIVNKKYLSRTNNPFNYSIGDEIKIDESYFIKASKEFYIAGLLLSLNSWAKWDKEKITDAIKEILYDSFNLLKIEDFESVVKLTEYAKKIDPRDEDQEDILMRVVFNRLIALKKIKSPLLAKELKNIKVGTASPMFKLGYSILKDDHTAIIDLIKKTELMGDIDLDRYNEWPIYSFLREQSTLNELIVKELSKKIKKTVALQKKKILPSDVQINTAK